MTQFLRKTLLASAVMVAMAGGTVAFAADAPPAAAAKPAMAAAPAKPAADTAAINAKFKSDKEKYSYMVGMDMARNLTQIKDELDVATLVSALQSSLKGDKMQLSEPEELAVRQEFMQKLQAKQAEKNKDAAEKNQKEGDDFLAKNKSKAGVKTTESGLQYEVIKQGTGAKPKGSDIVKVDYTGTKIDGTKFDSSVDRGQPATFPLNGVIPGWTEGLQLMPVGSEYKLYIPAKLAYADHGPPPIGPNATLIFNVKLISIEPPAADAKPAAAGQQPPKIVPPKPADKH
jgi:FKBP-type peptidyl-prolyl cis-trans isomerase FkpA